MVCNLRENRITLEANLNKFMQSLCKVSVILGKLIGIETNLLQIWASLGISFEQIST